MSKKKRKQTPLKSFLSLFLIINVFGLGLNFLLYHFKLPNQFQFFIENYSDVTLMSFAVFCYVILSLLLYLVISLNYFFKEA